MIIDDIKKVAVDTGTPKLAVKILKFILGEFDRVKKKPCSDGEAVVILKGLIKSSKTMLEFQRDPMEKAMSQAEIDLMTGFLPAEIEIEFVDDATMKAMIAEIVPEGEKTPVKFTSKVSQALRDKGYEVDNRRLSEILRGAA
ncbi:MAG: hypothetical protein GY799_21170 [Desulfobulbaceae bacterium]|nr:hypothetical protein [Desulfobulbaceae bacterium]